MKEQSSPRLWSDFDGTAVGNTLHMSPLKWPAHPLKMVDGYGEFLRGVSNSGVEIAGIVSRRKDTVPIRLATRWTAERLGIGKLFPPGYQLLLAGNESRKAQVVANESRHRVVGMIDDRPHLFTVALLECLKNTESDTKLEVVIGAVKHNRSSSYMYQLGTWATLACEEVFVEIQCDGSLHFDDPDDRFSVKVYPVQPYSEASGQAFGQLLASANELTVLPITS